MKHIILMNLLYFTVGINHFEHYSLMSYETIINLFILKNTTRNLNISYTFENNLTNFIVPFYSFIYTSERTLSFCKTKCSRQYVM